jgi:hypothetical protein
MRKLKEYQGPEDDPNAEQGEEKRSTKTMKTGKTVIVAYKVNIYRFFCETIIFFFKMLLFLAIQV